MPAFLTTPIRDVKIYSLLPDEFTSRRIRTRFGNIGRHCKEIMKWIIIPNFEMSIPGATD
jgi:hypothetical protein